MQSLEFLRGRQRQYRIIGHFELSWVHAIPRAPCTGLCRLPLFRVDSEWQSTFRSGWLRHLSHTHSHQREWRHCRSTEEGLTKFPALPVALCCLHHNSN